MQFNALGKKAAPSTTKKAKVDLPFNVAMRLERIEIVPGKAGLFHGFNLETNEPVTVRMASIEEGVAVNQRAKETAEECTKRIRDQYVGVGESQRPRPADFASEGHKSHCRPGGLMVFTKCMKNEDGTLRAHWAETLEKEPGAGCDNRLVNVRIDDIRDPKDYKKITGTLVAADVISPDNAVLLNKDNAVEAMLGALNNREGNTEVKRRPFAVFRLLNPDSGDLYLPPFRISGVRTPTEEMDHDTGEVTKRFEVAPAEESLVALMSPASTSYDESAVRSALFGLGDEPGYPVFPDDMKPELKADCMQITDAVRSGKMVVEMIPGDRIYAGPKTRASIVKSVKNNPRNPLNSLYTRRDPESGRVMERKFAPTFLTTTVGKDGYRIFTKAVAVECFPKGLPLNKIATINDVKGLTEAAQSRAAEATSEVVDVPDDVDFDPLALDREQEAVGALAKNAETLTANM